MIRHPDAVACQDVAGLDGSGEDCPSSGESDGTGRPANILSNNLEHLSMFSNALFASSSRSRSENKVHVSELESIRSVSGSRWDECTRGHGEGLGSVGSEVKGVSSGGGGGGNTMSVSVSNEGLELV
jgi:hypothetical protein